MCAGLFVANDRTIWRCKRKLCAHKAHKCCRNYAKPCLYNSAELAIDARKSSNGASTLARPSGVLKTNDNDDNDNDDNMDTEGSDDELRREFFQKKII